MLIAFGARAPHRNDSLNFFIFFWAVLSSFAITKPGAIAPWWLADYYLRKRSMR